jgi:hypothetical protein
LVLVSSLQAFSLFAFYHRTIGNKVEDGSAAARRFQERLPAGLNGEAFSRDAVSRPTGQLTTYQASQNFSSFASPLSVVSKSGTNVARLKARGAGGGSGTGAGSSGGSASAPASVMGSVVVSVENEAAPVLSPEDRRLQALRAKLHPAILAVVDRLNNKTAAGAEEVKFIRDGKAEIQVWLTDKSAETLAQLKSLGFEVVLDPPSAKMRIGRLPVEKLVAIAELKAVRYVVPQATRG